MTSAINPQNIDGAYPVAGQDNDSQGFRDNFTNIKTNFTYAAQEITDLQSKAVLKAALTGTVLDNDMGGSILRNAQLQDMSETRVALPGTGAQTVNYAAGAFYTLTTAGPVSIAFTNFPAAGTAARVRLQIEISNTAHTLTLPAAVSVGTNNIQGFSNSVITFNRIGTYLFEFVTIDGGSTITIIDLNRNLDPMYLPGYETFAANGNINLNLTASVITSSGNITGNLLVTSTATATGNAAAGQIKTLIYGNTAVGNCLVNVVDAGWKASGNGTANLSAVGSAATFQYINGKWFCIGNNGVTFS